MPRTTERFIQPGDTLDMTVPVGGCTPGDGILSGTLFGVALDAKAAGAQVPAKTTGVWDLPKTAAQTFAEGALVYWDNTAKSVTAVSTGNTRIGSATRAAAGGDATARVRLSGVPAPAGA